MAPRPFLVGKERIPMNPLRDPVALFVPLRGFV